MAKGNLILGTMSGKLGDIVAYTNNGKQCARVRRRVVRNPKSAGQQIQRMILNTAAQFVSEMRPVLNNGFEGIQKGAPSLAYARKLAMNRLRYENMYETVQGGFRYVARGGNYFAPSPLVLSKGSLVTPVYRLSGGQYYLEGGFGAAAEKTLSEVFPWAEPGMQFTFIFGWIRDDGTATTKFISFVFKDDETPIFTAVEGGLKLNGTALDSAYSQGDVSRILVIPAESGDVNVAYDDPPLDIAYSAFIYSTRDGSKRSNAELIVDADFVPQDFVYDAPSVFPTYGDVAVDSGAPADYFLDNNPG